LKGSGNQYRHEAGTIAKPIASRRVISQHVIILSPALTTHAEPPMWVGCCSCAACCIDRGAAAQHGTLQDTRHSAAAPLPVRLTTPHKCYDNRAVNNSRGSPSKIYTSTKTNVSLDQYIYRTSCHLVLIDTPVSCCIIFGRRVESGDETKTLATRFGNQRVCVVSE